MPVATTVAMMLARTTGTSVRCRTRLNTAKLTTTPAPPTAPNFATSRTSASSRDRSALRSLMVIVQLPSWAVSAAVILVRSLMLTSGGEPCLPSVRSVRKASRSERVSRQ